MKKLFKITSSILLMLSVLFTPVFAETNSFEIEIPVKIEGMSGHVVIEGDTTEGLPEETSKIISEKDSFLLSFKDVLPGSKYHYQVKQIEGNETNVKYDDQVYDVWVEFFYVGDKMAYVVYLSEGELPTKPVEVCFVNERLIVPTPTPTPTPSPTPSSSPSPTPSHSPSPSPTPTTNPTQTPSASTSPTPTPTVIQQITSLVKTGELGQNIIVPVAIGGAGILLLLGILVWKKRRREE